MKVFYSPVISPELLSKTGSLSCPSDLQNFPIIHQHDNQEWRNWLDLAGCPDLKLSQEVVVVDSNLVQRAVEDGQGVGLGVFPLMAEEVKQGLLAKPFDIDLHPDRAFYLLTRKDVEKRGEVKAVCNWIVNQI